MKLTTYRVVTLLSFGAAVACFGSSWFGAEIVAQNSPTTKSVEQNRSSNADNAVSTNAGSGPSNATTADDAIRKKLLAKCDFKFEEVAYPEVEKKLKQQLGVNIILTTSAMDDALTKDETFNCQLSGITYASALRTLLAPKNATYCIQGGVVKIISLDEVNDGKWLAHRMIDVSETLDLIRNKEKDRIGKPESSLIKFDGGFQEGTPFMSAADILEAQDTSKTKDTQDLANAIIQAAKEAQLKVQGSVALVTAESLLLKTIKQTDSNVRMAGDISLTCIGGVLIVTAPEEVNEKIESFVEDLKFKMKTAAAKK